MFGPPKNGWSAIQLEQFQGDASYMTDVPMDCLNAALFSLTHNAPFSLFIDEEGSELHFYSYYKKTYIIRQDDSPQMYALDLDFKDLIAEICTDIQRDFDGWCDWFDGDALMLECCYGADTTLTLQSRGAALKEKLSALQELLNA